MQNNNSRNDGRSSTYGRALMNYISSKLPYSSFNFLENIQQTNPKYKDFYQTGSLRDEALQKHSISSVRPPDNSNLASGRFTTEQNYHNYMYANVDYDKGKRIRDYRVMAAFAEVSDALDEICDEFINVDNNGEVCHLRFNNMTKFDEQIRKELHREFRDVICNLEIKEKGWEYIRQLLIDGEIFFEHIIHEDYKKEGILGFQMMPVEMVDPIYDNIQNLLIKGFLLRKPVLDEKGDNLTQKDIEHIPMAREQVSYFHSGIWNETKTLRLPFIENARRAYRQLSLIEDSIIIYRLARAPERLVFNVDTGRMSAPQAEAYLQRLIQNYWSRKTYDTGTGNIDSQKLVQTYNPQSMLDNYWFAKREGSEGTTVTQLQGGQNLGELEDLHYFVKKLYKALKVPVGRVSPESTYDIQGASILREELKFANFIVRIQQNFAEVIKETFIVHLKLKGLWEDYKIHENDIFVEFNPPANFYELRQQQTNEIRFNNFNQMAANEYISDTFSQKKYLNLSDEEIKANRELLKVDAALRWELTQIEAGGPNWRELVAQQPQDGEAIGGPGGGAPPSFGPAPGGGFGGPEDFEGGEPGEFEPGMEGEPMDEPEGQPGVPGQMA